MKQAVHGTQQVRGLDGLHEERLGRLLGLQGSGAVRRVGSQSAHGDDRDVGAELRQRAGQLRAAETWHVHVCDNDGVIRGAGDEQDDRLHAVCAAQNPVAVLFQYGGADVAEPGIIVDDKDQGMKLLLDHPETKDRIAAIDAVAVTGTPTPLLDAADWSALKQICAPLPVNATGNATIR